VESTAGLFLIIMQAASIRKSLLNFVVFKSAARGQEAENYGFFPSLESGRSDEENNKKLFFSPPHLCTPSRQLPLEFTPFERALSA
jgi:hypothetical protein